MPRPFVDGELARADFQSRMVDRHDTDITRIWRRLGELGNSPPAGQGGSGGGGGGDTIFLATLSAALYPGGSAAAATTSAGAISVQATYAKGYLFSGQTVWVVLKEGQWHPIQTGGYHFEGQASEAITQPNSGDVALTETRGTITATARYGDVDNNALVSVHWDDAEGTFFIGDAECSA